MQMMLRVSRSWSSVLLLRASGLARSGFGAAAEGDQSIAAELLDMVKSEIDRSLRVRRMHMPP